MSRDDPTAIRAFRLSHCFECETPFAQPISDDQAFFDWGFAAADEIVYVCSNCAEDFERGEDHYGR